ncbi:MAG: antibiotic biosynthesis monooxygenase [Gemmataceae bacterium]|nr:antibiotic biosynthesis monooxygenase [Gemmataceae bacterium]
MVTISKDRPGVTLVNVFRTDPARQAELVALLVEATEAVMRHLPGFVSATIHRSLDGTRVTNYAQWRSAADFEAMTRHPDAAPHMMRAAEPAQGFDPNLYEVVESVGAAG